MSGSKKDLKKKMERIICILSILDSRGKVTAESLANEFGVVTRTIYRDIALLNFAEIPIEHDFDNKTYRFRGDFSLRKLNLSPEEMHLMIMMRQFAKSMGTHFQQAADSIMEKVVKTGSCVPATLPHYFKMDTAFADPDLVTKNFKMLEKCIKYKKCAKISYKSIGTGDISERKIAPYYMVWGIGETYVRAFCYLRGDTRTFALDGINELKMTDEPFKMPTDLNPEDEIKNGFGIFFGPVQEVEIRFKPEVEHLVRRKIWHPSQTMTKAKDGSIILKMKITSYDQLIFWILGWGENAELLKPKDIRMEITDIIKNAADIYMAK